MKHLKIDVAYLTIVDKHFQEMMAANAAEPYVHAEYERCDRMASAALVLLTKGDQEWANALRLAFTDSNEPIEYYIRNWSRDALVYDLGTYADTDRSGIEHRIGLHDDAADWVDSCAECKAAVPQQD